MILSIDSGGVSDPKETNVYRGKKIKALLDVAKFNPTFTLLIIVLGLAAAVFEGIGLSFILPIIEIIQAEDPTAEAEGAMLVFIQLYQTAGIPFTLGYVILGVTIVMTIRYTMSFLVAWFREALRTYYIRDLQLRAFNHAIHTEINYFDQEGSDDILNAIVTQTYYAGRVIQNVVKAIEKVFLSGVYLTIAIFIAPWLTLLAITILGGLTIILRNLIEPGYKVGDLVADANERRQGAAQAATQGIRDIRIFGLAEEIYTDFVGAVDQYTNARITLRRNEAAISNFYTLGVAISVFILIYIALTFANLSFGALGVFLFAMFQLGPVVSRLNEYYYKIENDLPHLVRTQTFIQELSARKELNKPTQAVPKEIENIEFDNVWFSYDDDEWVLRGVNFEVEKGEFVGFVGQSGAGKSTLVSLLARFYEPDQGAIRTNDIPIIEIDINNWREKIAIVRQSPFIFNDTLYYNLTIGNRNVTRNEIEEVCKMAKVDEFIDELPKGYDTILGDEGVRLSGGQRQRVSLARALLEDAELLILDEATSDLDSSLEQEVQNAIEEMERDYTIITIAHRLSTVENADRIYTMEDGEIIEAGSHEELIKENGKYSELYSIQSKK